MIEADNKTIKLLKDAFKLDSVRQEGFIAGLLSGKDTRYFIPETSVKEVLSEFPFMNNAVEAGLIAKDKKSGDYFTTASILSVNFNNSRKPLKKQFFSINGDDKHERTTLKDALATLLNLRYISSKFGVVSDSLSFTLRHENGNPDKPINYVELDKRLFGNTEDEIVNNINGLNEIVKYERNSIN